MPACPLAWVDGPTGLAGNMLLAALLDAGLPQAVIEEPLARLGLAGRYRLDLEERRSFGLRGLHLTVVSQERQPPHRHWGELEQQIREAALDPPLAERVLAVFGLLAEAEAAVHGGLPGQVHFHEVGGLDALVDVVGVCAGLLHFGVKRLICTPPPAGHGSVRTAHGLLPLPAPAVLEIARRCCIPLGSSGEFPAAELTTPTGLALMAVWAEAFAVPPPLQPLHLGCGLGSRELDRPNLLRLVLAAPAAHFGGEAGSGSEREANGVGLADGDAQGDPALAAQSGGERREPLLVQQAQIDDASPEDLAFLAEALRDAGALEVFSQPVLMKKGRQGTLLTALLPPPQAAALRRIWWRHSTTLGLRERLEWRWVWPRQQRTLTTALGSVRIKQAVRPGDARSGKPEFEDLALLARRHGLPLQRLRRWLTGLDPEPEPELHGESESAPGSALITEDRGSAPERPWAP